MILPYEIYIRILDLISDTKTYLACRLVCREWYKYLKNIKTFKDNEHITTITFFKNKILVTNTLDTNYKEYIFNDFGGYQYNFYNQQNLLIKKIESKPPYKLIRNEYGNNWFIKHTYDTRNDKIDKSYFTIPSCIIS